MKALISLILVFLFSLSASQAIAQEKLESGMIYGASHAYILKAPRGWVMDNKSAVPQGLHAVFYPEGSSWANGIAVMYTNVLAKTATQKVEDVIAGDVADFKKNSPTLKIEDATSIKLEKAKTAIVKQSQMVILNPLRTSMNRRWSLS